MPKPLYGDNGSGMHTHQSIWKDNKPLFAGSGYADLSETALYYIGGIIKHAKALNAFCNASTNSYKRVIPGFEAPVLLAYSSRNRSASCRIPYSASPKGKRVEVRFPGSVGQSVPRLRGDADGRHRRHPEQDPSGRPDGQEPVRPAAGGALEGSDRRGLAARGAERARRDRTFLTKGGVFTDDQIDAYMELKWEEVYNWEHQPAPIEYKMYYSV
jgi:glutamine synthetase